MPRKERCSGLGPGGIKCPCCGFGIPKQTRVIINRDNRRKVKRNLRAIVKGVSDID